MKNESQQPNEQYSWELESEIDEYDDFSKEQAKKILKSLKVVETALDFCTGHDEYQRRKIAYYAVATHFIQDFHYFPGMVLYGPPGTGKSSTLIVMKEICKNAVPITGDTYSTAAFKACMKIAELGTLIIEEADSLTDKELENLLTTRYSVDSAKTGKMVQDESGHWSLEESGTYGATVAHRRRLYRDPATLRRVIVVKTKRVERPGGEFEQVSVKTQPGLFKCFGFTRSRLPEIGNRWNIEPAIFDLYRPILTLVDFVKDYDFLQKLLVEIKGATANLIEEESYLDHQALLKVMIILAVPRVAGKPTTKLINIEVRHIDPVIKSEFGVNSDVFRLHANQRNRIIRDDLKFQVKSAGGRMRVYFTIPQLIEACREFNVQDDSLDGWEQTLKEERS